MHIDTKPYFTIEEKGMLTLFCQLIRAAANHPDDDLFDTEEMSAVLAALVAKLDIDMSDEYISYIEQEALLKNSLFLSNLAVEIKDCKAEFDL